MKLPFLYDHPKLRSFFWSFIFVDIPVFTVIAIVGSIYGFQHTMNAVMEYRMHHLWTMIPSVVLFVVLWRRWRHHERTP